jgi:ABC-type sugar transport system substrate-binding protein
VAQPVPVPVSGGRLGTDTVGVVIAGLNPFYLPLLTGIEEVAAEQGTLVLIADSHDSEVLASAVIRRLIARGVFDGRRGGPSTNCSPSASFAKRACSCGGGGI